MTKCLYCYQNINSEENTITEYHERCSKKFFGTPEPPILDYSQDEMYELARKVISTQRSITGVQPKLSLNSTKESTGPNKLTIVGLWGQYILKPQTEHYPHLPENESLTMHLAEKAGIKTVEHSLIRLKAGELAYITKRIDRVKNRKIHMEDMCQITERLTEHKYKGSYEQIGKAIKKYSANPGFDLVNFYEIVLFSFLIGNNDMHLKNFSLIKSESKKYSLCPAYDLLASELVVEGDDEELALTLNARKKKIKRKDFQTAMMSSGLNEKVIQNIFSKFEKQKLKWKSLVKDSFLDHTIQESYIDMIEKKFDQITP